MVDRRSSLGLITLLVFLPALGCDRPYPGEAAGEAALKVIDPGDWKGIGNGAEFRKVTLERAEPYQVINLKILRFDTRSVFPSIVQSPEHEPRGADVKSLGEKTGALAMINANYFDEKGKPLGFLKVRARSVNAKIAKSSLYTGILGIKNRLPFIVHRDDFLPEQADEGLQAGPLLLAKGKVLTVKRGAGKQSRRSLIGLDGERRLLVAVADSLLGGLSWAELQEIFGSDKWNLQAVDLLNLDGGGSTQLYVKVSQLEEYVAGKTGVPVAIGFFPR